jgi:hypothetical protein
MSGKVAAALAAAVFYFVTPAAAHRLDEYLQATLVSVEHQRMEFQMRLTPGVAVLQQVLAAIDTNSDGIISPAEQDAYARQVLRDLSLTADGSRVALQIASVKFPEMAEMKEGLGEIQIDFTGELPRGGSERRIRFENRHLSRISVYSVNSLVPRDPAIHIIAQNRNYGQTQYELQYTDAAAGNTSLPLSPGVWIGAAALALAARFAVSRRKRAASTAAEPIS